MQLQERIITYNEFLEEADRKYILGFSIQSDIILIYRENKIKWHLIIKDFPWYFCILKTDYRQHIKLFKRLKLEDKIQRIASYKKSRYIKIYCQNNNKRNVFDGKTSILQECKYNNIQTYEADIPSHLRLLIDCRLQIEEEYQKIYIDIETDDRRGEIRIGQDRIISIAAMTPAGKVYYYTDQDEKKLLKRFLKRLSLYDIAAQYNGEHFDIPYLQARCRIHRLYYNWKQIIHVDLMQKLMEINRKNYKLIRKVRSFSLEAVSQEFLGSGKLKRVSTWEMFTNDPERLKKYNIRDVELLKELDKKLNIIKQKIVEHSITGCFLDEYAISRILDIYILRNAKKGTRFNTKPPWQKDLYENREARYKGGLVLEPVRGIHEQVYHMDVTSMYPSIIRTFNISPETWQEIADSNHLKSPNNQFYSKEEGIIPSIIGKLLQARNDIRYIKMKGMSKEDPAYTDLYFKQYAFKTMANSFYGILGAPFTRYFKAENAEAITLTGQFIVYLLKDYFEDEGMEVLYSDTDSVFIKGKNLNSEQTCSKVNTFISYHLAKHFNISKNYISLKVEAIYKQLLLVNKKRYAKIENGELVIVGLEAKRRETIVLAATMQIQLLEMLLLEKASFQKIEAWLLRFKNKILSGKLSQEEVLIQIRLSKDVDKYDKKILDEFGEVKEIKESKLPHIKVAKWLKAHSIKEADRNSWEKGSYVKYIITGKERGKGLTAESIHNYQEGSYDSAYYWNHKFYPMLQRILEVVYPAINWEEYQTV